MDSGRAQLAALLALLEDHNDSTEYIKLSRGAAVDNSPAHLPPERVSPYLQRAASAEDADREILDACYPVIAEPELESGEVDRSAGVIVASVRGGTLQLADDLPDLPAFRSKPPTPPMTPLHDISEEYPIPVGSRLGTMLPAGSNRVTLRPNTALPASMTSSVMVLSAVDGGDGSDSPVRASRLADDTSRMTQLKATRTQAHAVVALQHATLLAAAVSASNGEAAAPSGASTTSVDAALELAPGGGASPLSSHLFMRSLAPQSVIMVPLSSVQPAVASAASNGSAMAPFTAAASTRSQRFDLPTASLQQPAAAVASPDSAASRSTSGATQSPAALRAAMPTFSRRRYDAAASISGSASGASSPSTGSMMSPSTSRMARLPIATAASGARTSPGTAVADRRRFDPITVRVVNGAAEDDDGSADTPTTRARTVDLAHTAGAPLRALNVLMRRAGHD